ncbi:MAG: hypothetical protein ACO1RX_23205 [Candidatus Sericytochromatia bacterium]
MMMNALDSSRHTLAAWIWEELSGIEFSSFYDPFGGNARVAQLFKRKGYQTFVSDILQCHYWRGVALVQNNSEILTPTHFQVITEGAQAGNHADFNAWQDHYFTKDEVQLLGGWWHNIENYREFQESPELKAMAYTAVYLTMGYWLNFNQMYLQSKPMPPQEALRYYVQQLNSWVSDNQMPNMSYYTDAYQLVDQLPADVILVNPPAMSGFRDTHRKTELAECWTRRVAQINLAGVIPVDSKARLGQAFEDEIAYLEALSRFLDHCQGSRVWVLAHSDRLGISFRQLEELVASKRSVWKKSTLDIAYPMAGDSIMDKQSLLIAVSE